VIVSARTGIPFGVLADEEADVLSTYMDVLKGDD